MQLRTHTMVLTRLLVTLLATACSGQGGSCPNIDSDTTCTTPLPGGDVRVDGGDGEDTLSDSGGTDLEGLDQSLVDLGPVDIPLDIPSIDAADVSADSTTDHSSDEDQLADSEQPPELPSWTLMVYMNGDNNLSEDALADLDEITAALWTDQIRVVVLVDTLFGGAEELSLGADGFELLDTLGEIDMSDWTELRDFGIRTVEAMPAQHYALILWDHGDGWTKPSPRCPAPSLFAGPLPGKCASATRPN